MTLRIGKIRRGISGSAVAAVAMAALTASQASEVLGAEPAAEQDPRENTAQGEPEYAQEHLGLPYHTDLPPLLPIGPAEPPLDFGYDPEGEGEAGGGGGLAGAAEAGIPATVLDAYRQAEAAVARSTPGCGLDWQVLAAIGKVESGHASGGRVDADGNTLTRITGPQLNGNGFARILDTDGGRWDGDPVFDRAVGPMQFIPSTWAMWGADGNGDGVKDPNNVYDAALAAGNYLCAGGRDLTTEDGLNRALLSYNHSWDYVRTVRSWLDFYYEGTHEVPDGTGRLPTSPGPGRPSDGGGDAGREQNAEREPQAPGAEAGKRPSGQKPAAPKPADPIEGGIKPIDPPPAPDPGPSDPPGEDPDTEDPDTQEPGPEDPDPENPEEPGEQPECPVDPDEEEPGEDSGTEDGAQESEDASPGTDGTGDADDEGTEDDGEESEESEDPEGIEGCDDDEDTDEDKDGDGDAGDEEGDASQGEDPVTQSAATLTRRV
ncbi:lytic murein transglycosylase [Streptomyces xiamenensis]